jgi:hypothetical protein
MIKKILILSIILLLSFSLPMAGAVMWDLKEIITGKQMVPDDNSGAPWFADNSVMYFGTDKDASLKFNSVTGYLEGVGFANRNNYSLVLISGEDLTFAGGDSKADLSGGSGVTKTTTGAVTIGPGAVGLTGTMTVAATKDITAASTGSDFDFSLSTDGIFKTPGGAVTIGPGAIALSGSPTVATGKTLAVVDADKLTVGGVIVPQYWDFNVPIAAATVDTNIFIPTSNWQVVAVSEVHSVAGNDAGAVSAIVRKTNSTGAPSAGVAVTAGTFDLKGTANTIQSGVVRSGADAWVAKVNSTERLTLDVTGTLSTLAGGVVTVRLKRV